MCVVQGVNLARVAYLVSRCTSHHAWVGFAGDWPAILVYALSIVELGVFSADLCGLEAFLARDWRGYSLLIIIFFDFWDRKL